MQRLESRDGLRAIGIPLRYPALVEGTLPPHSVTGAVARPAGPDELAALFEDAMGGW